MQKKVFVGVWGSPLKCNLNTNAWRETGINTALATLNVPPGSGLYAGMPLEGAETPLKSISLVKTGMGKGRELSISQLIEIIENNYLFN